MTYSSHEAPVAGALGMQLRARRAPAGLSLQDASAATGFFPSSLASLEDGLRNLSLLQALPGARPGERNALRLGEQQQAVEPVPTEQQAVEQAPVVVEPELVVPPVDELAAPVVAGPEAVPVVPTVHEPVAPPVALVPEPGPVVPSAPGPVPPPVQDAARGPDHPSGHGNGKGSEHQECSGKGPMPT